MWNSGDGPECDPEWHGMDRGSHSEWGCLAAVISVVAIVLLMVYALGVSKSEIRKAQHEPLRLFESRKDCANHNSNA